MSELPPSPRAALLRALRDEALRVVPTGRAIIAIDGIDGAGKTRFAADFAAVVRESGRAAFTASIDGFHRPRAERYRLGRDSPEGFYRDSYDYDAFARALIAPFRDGAQTAATTGFQTEVWDLAADAPTEARWLTGPREAVLIVDGIFLHRPGLAELWDWSVLLEVTPDTAQARLAARDGADPDPAAPSNRRYREGQRLYAAAAKPWEAASVIVDNNDVAHPVRMRGTR